MDARPAALAAGFDTPDTPARLSHTASQREAGEGRGYEARSAWRSNLGSTGAYLDSTVSTASKRNEVGAALSRLAADVV